MSPEAPDAGDVDADADANDNADADADADADPDGDADEPTGAPEADGAAAGDAGGPRKLHPLTVVYRLAQGGLQIGVAIVFVGLPALSALAGADPAVMLVGVAAILLFVGAVVGYLVLAYRRFEYELTDDTFDIREGVLSRREREIPLRRIQNVDVSQNVVQRALDIAGVNLETAGGGSTEAELHYVGTAEATRLQTEISRRRRAGEGESAAPATEESMSAEPLFEIAPRELLVLAVVSIDLRVISFLVVGASLFFGSAPAFADPEVIGGVEGLLLSLLGPLASLVVLVLAALAAGALRASVYYGFTLHRRGDELRYERGLFQRYSGTIPLSKVQSLTVKETVLARAFGYASLTIETAGYTPGSGGDDGSKSAVPLADRDRVFELARDIEDDDGLALSRPPKRARQRYAARYAGLVAVVAGALWLLNWAGAPLPPWYYVLPAFLLVPPAAHLKWANRGYAVGENHVVTQNGFWSRRRMVVPYHRVQTVLTSETIFQRRRDLGTLTVDTAGSTSLFGGDARAVDVDAGTAADLRESVPASLSAALARRRRDGRRRGGRRTRAGETSSAGDDLGPGRGARNGGSQ